MNPKLIRWLTFLLAIAALAGFVVTYYKLLHSTWTKEDPPGPQLEFLASTLSGLVGGIVAAAFGQKLPDPPARRKGGLARYRLNASGRFLSPIDEAKYREGLAAAYALVYLGMSIWAIVVWVNGDENTPKLINNLAVVSIGLIIAIVTAYFSDTGQ